MPEPRMSRARLAALATWPGCGRIWCRWGWNGRSVPSSASADMAAVMSATRNKSSASLHAVVAIDQRQAFLGLELERLQLRGPQRLRRGLAAAVGIDHLAFPDKRQ